MHHIGPAVCKVCQKVTPNSKALQAHMLIHKQPDKECLVCGRRFKHSSKLRVSDNKNIFGNKFLVYELSTLLRSNLFVFFFFNRSILTYTPALLMRMSAIFVAKNSDLVHRGQLTK